MNPLPSQQKLRPSEYFWLALLALYAVSMFNLGGYILVVLLAAYLMLNIRNIEASPLLLSLMFFSGFYFTFYLVHFTPSITEVFNYLIAPWAAFAFGELFTRKSGSRLAPYYVIGTVAMGMFAHGLLNLIAYLGSAAARITGRAAYDFWRREIISVTANGLYFPMALGLSFGALFSDFKKSTKLLALAIVAAAGINAALLGHRTSIFIIALLALFHAAAILLRSDTPEWKKGRLITSGCVGLIMVLILWVTDFCGFRTWIEGSSLFQRMTNPDQVHSTSRLVVWQSFFREALFHPFGGSAYKLADHQNWVHNLWLDVYYKVGIVPFVCLIIPTVLIVAQLIMLRRYCRKSGYESVGTVMTSLYLAVMLSCMVEPIIDANPYFLISFFMITGCISGMLRKGGQNLS